MRKRFAVFVLAAGLTTGAAAQQTWHSEFGIQSGYTRIKPTGTGFSDDFVDVFGIPGFNLPGLLPANPSLFAIIPTHGRIAFELGLSADQADSVPLFGSATLFAFNARANYAITRHVYAAVGGAMHWVESEGESETQLGLQTAVGYRFPLLSGLRGRLEANVLFVAGADLLPSSNSYSVTFGVSKEFGGRERASAPAARASGRAWQPMVGVQGGYYRTHVVGGTGGNVTSLSIPAVGGGLSTLGTPVAPPTVFAVLPITRRLAIEPGLDLRRFQGSGLTVFGGNLSARFDYIVVGNWYAALGGSLLHIKATGADAETTTGVNVAWGCNFPLASDLGGRFELNYTMMRKNLTLGAPPLNTVGLQFAVTMPIK